MKSPIKYKSLEKILKKHLGNSKSIYIDVGREKHTRRHRPEGKNSGAIKTMKDGEPDRYFYDNYEVRIQKINIQNIIKITGFMVIAGKENWHSDGKRKIFEEDIENLDRLFKLLAKDGKMLKEELDKRAVVDRLSDLNITPEEKKSNRYKPITTRNFHKIWSNLTKTMPSKSWMNNILGKKATK